MKEQKFQSCCKFFVWMIVQIPDEERLTYVKYSDDELLSPVAFDRLILAVLL